MIYLVLSLDYELFGNGSGDVRRDMIEPTNRILQICDEHTAKVSIMLEVGAYWAMQKAEEEGLLNIDYLPSQEIERQVKTAVTSGHDVQLHLHPWWIGATFEENRWRLHPEYRRVTDLPNGTGSEGDLLSVVGVLCEGKRTLEALVRPVRADYECLVYRAAMFWGQPSGGLIRGLKMAGLAADSSVVGGLYETAPVPTDYRDVPPSLDYWWTSAEDISRSGRKGEQIIEFPVYSKLRPYVCNFKWTKLSATLKRRSVEKADTQGYGMMEARKSTDSLGGIIKKLWTLQPLKYDFCKLSANDMIRELRRLIKSNPVIKSNPADEDGIGTPVVMVGHSKDFWNDRNLAIFLKFVKEECAERVHFSTLGECTRRILEKDTQCARGPIDEALSPSTATHKGSGPK